MENYRCIICSKPVDEDGVLGKINDIKVSLCEEHADVCNQQCEGCAFESMCKVAAIAR